MTASFIDSPMVRPSKGGFWLGSPEETHQLPALSGPGEDYLNQIFQLLSSLGPDVQNYFQDLLSQNPEAFEKFAAPARREFSENIVPTIAEQFAGSGALSSSGFTQALGQAGAGLTERLQVMREGLRGQGISGLQQMGQTGLSTKPFGYQTIGAQPGFVQTAIKPTIDASAKIVTALIGAGK